MYDLKYRILFYIYYVYIFIKYLFVNSSVFKMKWI